MLKEGTKSYRGVEESVIRNIEACSDLAGTVKSAYGPRGMNKMVINHLQKLFITSDTATILSQLEVEHPAAKMLIFASQMQEQEVGDGTNSVLILASSLLENAEELIRMGLSPSEIADGYDLAAKKALEFLAEITCGTVDDLRNKESVKRALRGTIASKHYGDEDFLAELVSDACIRVLPKGEKFFNVDNVRLCKILGSGVSSSRVMHGMVFKKGVEGSIRKVEAARIAVFSCPFDLTQTETKGTVLINSAKELMDFGKGEEEVVENQVKSLHDAGVNVVVSGAKFGDIYMHFLNRYNIMAVRLTSKFDLRRLCRSVGATPQPKITAPSTEEIGYCDHVYLDEVGDTDVVIFKQDTDLGRISTIIIRGSSDNLMDDIERAIDDGINTFKALTKDNRLLAGAGACEIELARKIESFGELCPGLEQYAIQKFGLALESLAKQLADNAGLKTTEILSKLYAEHQAGKQNVGLDIEVEGGSVKDSVEAGILDLYLTKYWAIKLAANAASTVLRVDHIIVAKPAGGPKPRKPQAMDADDQE